MTRTVLVPLLFTALMLLQVPASGAAVEKADAVSRSNVEALVADHAEPDAYEIGDGHGGGLPTWSWVRDIASFLPRTQYGSPGWGMDPYTEVHTIDTATTTDWDEDWFKLTVSAQDFANWPDISYRIDAYTPDPDTDLVLDVYSSVVSPPWGNTLGGADEVFAIVSNDDAEWGINVNPQVSDARWSSVTFKPPAAGEYRIRVRPYYSEITGFSGHAGTYTLRIKAGQVIRLSGDDRIETAVRISQEGWPTRPQESQDTTVVLAYGRNFPDALSAAGLAGATGGPVLLTAGTYLPTAVSNEIKRVGARGVYIVGGEGVVGAGVVDDLKAFLPADRIVRVAGPNRYATSVEVLKKIDQVLASRGRPPAAAAFLVSGANFPDALAVSPIAYRGPVPILLTPPTYLHPSVESAITMYGIDDVVIAGGTGAVSNSVVSSLVVSGTASDRILRIAGDDRYETAKEVASWACDLKGPGTRGDGLVGTVFHPSAMFSLQDPSFNAFAAGWTYPDALSGGPLAGKLGAPLLLTPKYMSPVCLFDLGGSLPPGSTDWYTDLNTNGALPIQQSYLLGGTAAVSDQAFFEIDYMTGTGP